MSSYIENIALMNLRAKFATYSKKIDCYSSALNEFNENIGKTNHYTLDCIFYEEAHSFYNSESGTYFSEQSPSLMILYDDVKKIKPGDTCKISDSNYKMLDYYKVGSFGLCCIVRLEKQDGRI